MDVLLYIIFNALLAMTYTPKIELDTSGFMKMNIAPVAMAHVRRSNGTPESTDSDTDNESNSEPTPACVPLFQSGIILFVVIALSLLFTGHVIESDICWGVAALFFALLLIDGLLNGIISKFVLEKFTPSIKS